MRNPASGWAAVAVAIGLSATAAAQTVPNDRHSGAGATKDAPALSPEAKPQGAPKTGVLKPPDVDPKMSKPVPDIDPQMDKPPPGKPQPPTEQQPTPKADPR
jgi:hypothetical protein